MVVRAFVGAPLVVVAELRAFVGVSVAFAELVQTFVALVRAYVFEGELVHVVEVQTSEATVEWVALDFVV